MKKATKNKWFNFFLIFFGIFTLLLLVALDKISDFHSFIVSGTIFLPIIYILLHLKNKKVFITAITLIMLEIIILFATFRQLRLLFHPAKITDAKVIGFAHYFGYPFYFDTIIFFFIFLSPIIIVGLLRIIEKRNKK